MLTTLWMPVSSVFGSIQLPGEILLPSLGHHVDTVVEWFEKSVFG